MTMEQKTLFHARLPKKLMLDLKIPLKHSIINDTSMDTIESALIQMTEDCERFAQESIP